MFKFEEVANVGDRAPTAEELAAFQTETKERKASEKASKPKYKQLVNPTDEDAERLQALWNAKAKADFDERHGWGEWLPTSVRRMTQEQYSAASKGSYAACETVEVCDNGLRSCRWNATDPPVAFKIRKGSTGNPSRADAVIVLTDKPQKPLPLDWDNL